MINITSRRDWLLSETRSRAGGGTSRRQRRSARNEANKAERRKQTERERKERNRGSRVERRCILWCISHARICMPSVRSKSKGAWGSTPLAHHPSNGRLATLHEGPLCPVGNEETPIIPAVNPPRGTLLVLSLFLSFSLLSSVSLLRPPVRRFPPPPPLLLLRPLLPCSPVRLVVLHTIGMRRDSRCKIHSRSPDYAYRTVRRGIRSPKYAYVMPATFPGSELSSARRYEMLSVNLQAKRII